MKILLLTAATGGGHIRAASAVEEYIKNHSDHHVESLDTLKTIGRLVDKTVCDSYLFMARRAPSLFGGLYKSTNKENKLSQLVPKLSSILSHHLGDAIKSYDPDVIITTHPFATEMASSLKAGGVIDCGLLCLITDYGLHRAWVADRVDKYVVASEDMVPELTALDVPEEDILPIGIPVHQVFLERRSKEEARISLGLDPDRPTVTMMAGSIGVTNIIKLYNELMEAETDIQIVVITGRNEKLFEAFKAEMPEADIDKQLVFFTKKVELYMQASDLLITKPGGLTVSEALATNLPLVVFDAIPGQEEDNANFLERHGMGIRLSEGDDVGKIISNLVEDGEGIRRMQKNCEAFDKSDCMERMMEALEEIAPLRIRNLSANEFKVI